MKYYALIIFFLINSFASYAAIDTNYKGLRTIPIAVNTNVMEGNVIEVSYDSYVNKLEEGEEFANSLSSIEETWDIITSENIVDYNNQYFNKYLNWYLEKLATSILFHKIHKVTEKDSNIVHKFSKDSLDKLAKVTKSFGENPNTATPYIDVAKEYDYTYSEKLNLFLTMISRDIPEKELIRTMNAWKINQGIPEIYLQDYEQYFPMFLKTFNISEEEQEYILDLFESQKTPISSALHVAVKMNKINIFNKILENSKISPNTQDFLSQTPAHLASQMDWFMAKPYIVSLSKHSETDLNILDYQGWSPVFYALTAITDLNSSVKGLDYMFSAGADKDTQDYRGRNLISIASEINKKNVAQYLYKKGVPFPNTLSKVNSIVLPDFTFAQFNYKFDLDLGGLEYIFHFNTFGDGKSRADFREFQKNTLMSEKFYNNIQNWEIWKYYSLLELVSSTLELEEINRYTHLLSHLYEESEKSIVTDNIRAIYQGNLEILNKNFSDFKGISKLHQGLYLFNYTFETYNEIKVVKSFDLLERIGVSSNQFNKNKQGQLHYSATIGSYLNEATRTNQPEIVKFFLSKGADPTHREQSFVIRNSLVSAILMSDLLYRTREYELELKKNQEIIKLFMSHPNVTKDFLNQEILPGISYADLAALKGNLYALEQMFKKGVRLSGERIWESAFLEEATSVLGLLKTTEAILLHRKKEKKLPYSVNELEQSLKNCSLAFN